MKWVNLAVFVSLECGTSCQSCQMAVVCKPEPYPRLSQLKQKERATTGTSERRFRDYV